MKARYVVNFRLSWGICDQHHDGYCQPDEYRWITAPTRSKLDELMYKELLLLGAEIERWKQLGVHMAVHVCPIERRY